MFELPEYMTIAKQMSRSIAGKQVRSGSLGNSPHKFVWYNRKPKEFSSIIKGKTVGKAYSRGRWLFIPMNIGYMLVFGECGGRILFHSSVAAIPKKYHLLLIFDDDSALSAMTSMWGAMELYERGQESNRKYIQGMRVTPVDTEFTFEYFSGLIDECLADQKRSVKGLLTQDQLIPGLGNSIAQDIMFNAGLHPRHALDALTKAQRRTLFKSIRRTVTQVTFQGGRYDEVDLYGKPGRYRRIMDKNAVGSPCRRCGSRIKSIQYLGGAAYFCPSCQR